MNLETFSRPTSGTMPISPAFMHQALDEAQKANFEIDLDRLGAASPARRVPATVMALSAMASLAQIVNTRDH